MMLNLPFPNAVIFSETEQRGIVTYDNFCELSKLYVDNKAQDSKDLELNPLEGFLHGDEDKLLAA